jgi:uncharacterized phage-associated protein
MKMKKQVNALLYAIEEYPDIGRTKLMKFIFFVDLVIYNRRGTTILENEYVRMQHGPVPPYAFTLTSCSNEFFTVRQVRTNYRGAGFNEFRFTPLQKSDRDLFNDEEKSIFSRVISLLKTNTAVAISTITHQYDLWKNVGQGYTIPLDLFKLQEKELTEAQKEPVIINETECEYEIETPDSVPVTHAFPVTALMSERALSKDWLKPEEDEAWDYL